jgi:hypothetical protein
MLKITLSDTTILGLSTPYEIAPALGGTKFYDVKKIIWKLDYNTTPYEYTGSILFKIGNEQIAEFQADSLTSNYKVAAISGTPLCIDKCAPLIQVDTPITLELPGGAPINGDSQVYIEVSYLINEI